MPLESDKIDFLLDPVTGDLVIERGQLVLSSGLKAVAQGCRIRILMFQDEWFLNLDAGVPWRQRILGEQFSVPRLSAAMRKAILAVPGVVEIALLAVTFDGRTRVVSVRWSARTKFGDTPPDTLERVIR